jgi:hypothetical protein
MDHHVQVKDIKNRAVKIRIERNENFTVPIWKALTVGRLKVPIGLCEPYQDGLMLYYDDSVQYGAIKYGRFNVVLLRDLWMTKELKMNDLGNAVIYDEGVTAFEGGIGMWSKA